MIDSGSLVCLPGASRAKHEIYAALAELYGKGGPGVERSPEKSSEYYGIAADEATAVGKGKAAAKYYELQAAASS